MKIKFPKEYNANKDIIIPNNILKEFLQSKWNIKTVEEKLDSINSLIKELELQMGLKNHYPIQIQDFMDNTLAQFGPIYQKGLVYGMNGNNTLVEVDPTNEKGKPKDGREFKDGIKIGKSHLFDNEMSGADFLTSICHEMKHAEQKEIELGLILPHSKDEYQKIQENSGNLKKAYYLERKSQLYRILHLDKSNYKGLRYLNQNPSRLVADRKVFMYYFQFTEREAYKFGENMLKQLNAYAITNNLETDLDIISLSLKRNSFNTRVKDLEGFFGERLNPNNLPNFDYHQEMERIIDLTLHYIDTRECPEDVPRYFWGYINEMSKESYEDCMHAWDYMQEYDGILNKFMIDTINNLEQSVDDNFTVEEKQMILGLLNIPENDETLIEKNDNGGNFEHNESSNLRYEQNDDLEL